MANQAQVDRIRKTRNYLLDIIKDVPVEQLNKVPEGFSNNMIWHLGHMVAAQQGICYLRPGLQPVVADTYIQRYKPGTKPEDPVDPGEVAAIKQLMFSSLDQLETDLNDNRFANYPSWTTRYGVVISSIDDALDFLLFHEGLHAGYVTYMKRLV